MINKNLAKTMMIICKRLFLIVIISLPVISHAELPESVKVLEQMERVANWQVPRIDDLRYLNYKRGESLEQGR